MLDTKQRIEAALRGAKIAHAALHLMEGGVDQRTLRIVCQELAQQVRDLEAFATTCASGRIG